MGEEEKKAEETKAEENKEVKAEKPSEEKKTEDSKEAAPPPPPPPQEIVLRVYMHCDGCARKVRRSLKGFEGVEDVHTDCKTHKVVVKGEKADPLKVRDRVQAKSHRHVDLLSPIPKPPADDAKKAEEKEPPKPQEKKEVITAVLKVYMHCDACGQQLKRSIQRMKGVETAEPDMKSSQVAVKGVFDAPELVQYVYKRTGKHAVIVKQEPEKKAEEKAAAAAKEEKKAEEGEKEAKKVGGGGEAPKEKNEEGGGGGEAAKPEAAATEAAGEQEETKVAEVMKHEFMYHYPVNYHAYPSNHAYYPSSFAAQMYSPYPPQILSDENPNACSVM